MLDLIQEQLANNDFLSGGAVLMVLGTLLAYIRHVPKYIYTMLHRKFVTTVDISDQDDAFYWIQTWLAEHPYSKKSRLLTVSSKKTGQAVHSGDDETDDDSPDPTKGIEILFTPAPGKHILKFENHWILLSRIREKQQGSANNNMFWREMINMRTFVKDRDYFRRLFKAAMKMYFPEEDKRVHIYTPSYGNWAISSHRIPRDVDSIVLQGGLMNSLLSELKEFFKSSDWYKSRGIPYQKGYLLHGSPGNGKTSLVLSLASKFSLNIYLAKVAGTGDASFRDLMAKVPKHSIVLIEDVDCFFVKRKSQVEGGIMEGGMSFSGFLNAIDGVTGSEGRILIMTTNKIDLLDEALIRSGRIDRKVELQNATKDQARRLFLRFFPGNDRDSLHFANNLPNDQRYSMADLQGILLDNRNDPSKAIEAIAQSKAA